MKKNIIFIVFMLFAWSLAAAEVNITIESSSGNVRIGESFSVVANATGVSNAEDIHINGIENFDVVGRSIGTSVKIINGKMSSECNLQLNLIPKIAGKFVLSGSVNGKTTITNKVFINVEEGSKSSITDIPKKNGKDMFINNSKIPTKIYFGEKIPIIVDFYTKNQLSQAAFLEQPVYTGFVISDLEKEQAQYQILDNERYGKYNLQKSVLQPVKTGKIKLKSYTFRVDFVNEYGEIKTNDFKTNEADIEVLPLPEIKPQGFQNLVGNPKVDIKISPTNINYGESVSVKIFISGNCNLDSIEKIYPDVIDGVKIYQTLKSKKEEIQSGKYYAEKEIEAVLIPERSGKIIIPEIKIPYFNVESGKYESNSIKAFKIDVSGNVKGDKSNSSNFFNKKDNSETKDKISILEENIGLKKSMKIFTYILYGISGIVILVFIGFLMISKLPGFFTKRVSLEKLIELNFSVNLKSDSKDEIRKKIEDKSISDKIIFIIEEKEKEKFGFEYNDEKVKTYSGEIIEMLKKRKNKGN